MIELIFVIVIIGILALSFRPNFTRDALLEACNQVIRDIRYTQHLAMMDHKFDESNDEWYKSRWQLMFHSNLGSNSLEAYSIFSDQPSYTGNPDVSELAINPKDPSKYLTGGYVSTIEYEDKRATKMMNLGKHFGITDVSFTGYCYRAKRIAFDRIGRPFVGDQRSANLPYQNDRYMTSNCTITLTHEDGNTKQIIIEPESGYAYVSSL